MNTINKVQKSYIAGIVDGEGCISAHNVHCFDKRTNRKLDNVVLILYITNTNKDLIDWIYNFYGGYIYKKHRENCKVL